MIVKNLSQSFHPVPKIKINSNKSKAKNKPKAGFCIMPKNYSYSTVRTEIFWERCYNDRTESTRTYSKK